MKRIFLSMSLVLLMAGCATTNSRSSYSPTTGKLISKTTTSSDPVDKIMKEMKNKDIAWWNCGWFFTIELTLTDSSTYMPSMKIAGGKANTGHISLTKDSKQDMGECIRAMQTPLALTVDKGGIGIKEKTIKKAGEKVIGKTTK